ncbi:baseplate J/gp47 family protein [Caproicibacter sp.]|uniref:baseplate J/gp47 family protein n=1 Tax=Caproicibacter sp. TaxID=2814884 RepID=UPI003988CD3D
MIDTEILDEVLPVPDIDDLKDNTVAELQDAGFAITNFNSGGIFYTLTMIALKVYIELITLCRTVLSNMFVTHAEKTWLDLKAGDFAKTRKAAVKARGNVTVSRAASGDAVTISKGQVFKTQKDINGDELRFFSLTDTVLQQGALSVDVPVEAEAAGVKYNVSSGQIVNTLMHIEGIDTITNKEDWLKTEGSDEEDDDSLRSRTKNAWSELSTLPIADKYKNVAEAVSGVLFVRVDDDQPRGQGSVDIIVTGTAGAATENLLASVQTAEEEIKGPYDNIEVKSSTTQAQDISVTVTVSASLDSTGLEDKVKAALSSLLAVSKDRSLNELTIADMIYAIKSKCSEVQNVKFTTPTEDVTLETDQIIIAGTITVTVEKV